MSDLHAEAAVQERAGAAAADGSPGPWAAIDYGLFLDCVECGLCTGACPTYVELADENEGPRGRIQLMRAVVDGRLEHDERVQRHLDLCTQCRACETACPYEVRYGELYSTFRAAAVEAGHRLPQEDRFHRRTVRGVLPNPARLRRWLRPAQFAQRLGLNRLLIARPLRYLLPSRWTRLLAMLPPRQKRTPRLPHILPSAGTRRARVALFTGCLADVLTRELHWATARVLQANGCEVCVLRSQVCCGAWHFATGHASEAANLVAQNTEVFNANTFDAVITNVATCGAYLRQYGRFGPAEGREARDRLAAGVRDASEFLSKLGLEPPPGKLDLVVTYHDSCQLAHGQRVREQPRHLLQQIPGLTLVEMPESDLCCGASGTYCLTEPQMADRLGYRTLANIRATAAQVVVVSDLNCLLHLGRLARKMRPRIRILHPMQLLDLSYRRQPLQL